jgi:hypothetical protein
MASLFFYNGDYTLLKNHDIAFISSLSLSDLIFSSALSLSKPSFSLAPTLGFDNENAVARKRRRCFTDAKKQARSKGSEKSREESAISIDLILKQLKP